MTESHPQEEDCNLHSTIRFQLNQLNSFNHQNENSFLFFRD